MTTTLRIAARHRPPVEELDRLDAPRAERREAAAEPGDEHELQVAVDRGSLGEADERARDARADDVDDEDAARQVAGSHRERPRQRVAEQRADGARPSTAAMTSGVSAPVTASLRHR